MFRVTHWQIRIILVWSNLLTIILRVFLFSLQAISSIVERHFHVLRCPLNYWLKDCKGFCKGQDIKLTHNPIYIQDLKKLK